LLGVASPSDLIKDPTRTPFNIGYRIDLTDFTQEEARPLEKGLHQEQSTSELILKRVLYWTAGHPYLTQKLCDLLAKAGNGLASEQVVDQFVHQHLLAPDAGRTEQNLAFVRDRILRDKRRAELLRLYLRIVRGKHVTDDPRSPIHTALKLSGLVVARDGGMLTVRNRIYEQVFTKPWAKEAMPANWNRRVGVASVVTLLLGFGAWYEVFLPRPYIKAIQAATEDYPAQAYAELHDIPGYASKADELLAEYFDRRAMEYEADARRDESLLAHIAALTMKDSDVRRRRATSLIGTDYTELLATYREGRQIPAAVFSPDGMTILTGTRKFDGLGARLWSVQTGKPIMDLPHKGNVEAVAFSPNGKLILTGGGDGTARLWQTDTGSPVGKVLQHPKKGGINAVAFSPNGKLVLTGSGDGTARLWQTDTGAPVGKILEHSKKWGIYAVAFSPNGKFVVTGGGDGAARLWRTDTGTLVGKPLKHKSAVYAVAFNPNGKTIVTGSEDRTARIWHAESGTAIGTPMRHDGFVLAVAFSPNGEVVATGSEDQYVRFWMSESGMPIGKPLRHRDPIMAVSFAPNGKLIITGSNDGTARLWRVDTTPQAAAVIRHDDFISAVGLSLDRTLLVTSGTDGTTRLWRTDSEKPIEILLRYDKRVYAAAFSPDGRLLVTGSDDKTARLWNTETGMPIGEPFRHKGTVWAVDFSPDGNLLLTGSDDKTARLWQKDTGMPIGSPMAHEERVEALAFSLDGALAATADQGGAVQLWSTATGSRIHQLKTNEGPVSAVAFSHDSKFLLTAGSSRSLRVWQLANEQELGYTQFEDWITAIAFSPDGQRIMAATPSWIHILRFGAEPLSHMSSYLLPGIWPRAFRFLDRSESYLNNPASFRFMEITGTMLTLAIKCNGDSVRVEKLRLDSTTTAPLIGHPTALQQEFEKKLALKVEAGKIVPLYEVPVAAGGSGSKGGGF
jgi:WD40 repeat protein